MIKKTSLALAAAWLCGMAGTSQAQVVFDYTARWAFNDCSTASAVLQDVSGNNVNAARGSFIQCAADAEGRPNGAANFTLSQAGDPSAQGSVTVNNATFLPLSNQFAFSATIRPGAVPEGAVLTKGWQSAAGARKTFQLGLQKDPAGGSRLVLTVWFKPASGTTPVPVTLTSVGKIPASKWTQVGASYSPAGGLQLIVDGVVAASAAETRQIADEPAGGLTAKVWMGGGLPGQTRGYTGALDDVWVSVGGCADLTAGHVVGRSTELMIVHKDVVDDGRASGLGAWSFGRLMEQMVPAGPNSLDEAATMVETMFQTWTNTNLNVNGFPVPARTEINTLLLNAGKWPRQANGKLNLALSPLRLLAIVNRLDLQDLSRGQAGEGRFVFGVLDPNGNSQRPFTVILEYSLPAKTDADLRKWAKDWHALDTLPLGSPQYNTALQAITDRFALRGAALLRPNGNAINQVRTNEIALAGPWELRQFELERNQTTGVTTLTPKPVALTPDINTLNNTTTLANYINGQAANILLSRHTMPPQFGGGNFTGGSSPNDFPNINNPLNKDKPWTAPGVQASGTASAALVTRMFALNTCNGCHLAETGTGFLHVGTREVGTASELSGFLTGAAANVPDPRGAGATLSFDDLGARAAGMTKILNCTAAASGGGSLVAARSAFSTAAAAPAVQTVPAVGTRITPVTKATTTRVH